jgi:hypothetical protein
MIFHEDTQVGQRIDHPVQRMPEKFHAKGLDIPCECLEIVHRFLSLGENVKPFHGRSDVFHISLMELDRA